MNTQPLRFIRRGEVVTLHGVELGKGLRLVGIEGVEPHYLLVVERTGNLDTLEVRVEVDERLFSDEVKILQKLAKRIEKEIKDMLGVTCTAKLVEPKTIQRSEGKATRVIDNRHL